MVDLSIVLITLLFGHWVGDYLLQTTPMALQKGTSLFWLTIHILVYSSTLFAFSVIVFPIAIAFRFAVLNGALHWIVDFFTSRISKRYVARPRIYYPIIGFDQFIHISSLIFTSQIFR